MGYDVFSLDDSICACLCVFAYDRVKQRRPLHQWKHTLCSTGKGAGMQMMQPQGKLRIWNDLRSSSGSNRVGR